MNSHLRLRSAISRLATVEARDSAAEYLARLQALVAVLTDRAVHLTDAAGAPSPPALPSTADVAGLFHGAARVLELGISDESLSLPLPTRASMITLSLDIIAAMCTLVRMAQTTNE